jgi:rhamnose transport system permease protein
MQGLAAWLQPAIPSGHRGYNLALAALLGVELVALSLLSPHFLSFDAMSNIARLSAEMGLVSLGMLLVVLVGGIDLSVGAVLALAAVVLGLAIDAGMSVPASVAAALAVGVLAGLINGSVVAFAGVPSIIVTLATMAVFRGLALGLSGGQSFPLPEAMSDWAQATWAGLPTAFGLLAATALLAAGVLRYTRWGVMLFALGHNEVASRLAGLPVNRARVAAYAASGALAALAGVVFAARVTSAKADFGVGHELDAITVVVLSGASLAGGSANVPGLLLGLAIVGALRLGLTMVFVPAETQAVLIGVVLIAAVASRRLFDSARPAQKGLAPVGRTRPGGEPMSFVETSTRR